MSKNNKTEDVNISEELDNTQTETSTQAETVESVKEEVNPLEKLQSQLDTEKDRNLRLFAEFENFKKRTTKERIELFKTAGEDVIVSMLPVLDDFDRALSQITKEEEDSHVEGMRLIFTKLSTTLKNKGLEVVEVQKGDAFNADIHEAITQIPAPSKKLKGKIIDTVEKGYKLGDKIIRFPKVVIGQ